MLGGAGFRPPTVCLQHLFLGMLFGGFFIAENHLGPKMTERMPS